MVPGEEASALGRAALARWRVPAVRSGLELPDSFGLETPRRSRTGIEHADHFELLLDARFAPSRSAGFWVQVASRRSASDIDAGRSRSMADFMALFAAEGGCSKSALRILSASLMSLPTAAASKRRTHCSASRLR
jgi:hypothetical protein